MGIPLPFPLLSTMRVLCVVVLAALVATAASAGTCPSGDVEVEMTVTSATFNSPIGIDWHEPTDTVVMSVHYSGGKPFNFARVLQDGTVVQFSEVSGFTNEVKIATIKSGAVNMGGFIPGQLYVGNGINGQIARIDPSGNNVDNPWATLPSSAGLFRGSLYHDRTGLWGGDLIAVTTTGYVYRVNANGVGTQLASLGTHLEGLIVLPNNAADWGPWAGAIMAGAEKTGDAWLIQQTPTGINTTSFKLGINIEDLDIITPNSNFFGVNYGNSRIVGVSYDQWEPYVGKVLAVQEFNGHGLTHKTAILGYSADCSTNGGFYRLPVKSNNGVTIAQWEHVTFAHSGLKEVPIVPDCVDTVVQECDDGAYPTGADRIHAHSDDNCACLTFDAAGNAVACVN